MCDFLEILTKSSLGFMRIGIGNVKDSKYRTLTEYLGYQKVCAHCCIGSLMTKNSSESNMVMDLSKSRKKQTCFQIVLLVARSGVPNAIQN